MFKTLTVFRLADAFTRLQLTAGNLTQQITEPTVADPDSTQWSRAGFTNPGETRYPVYVSPNLTRLFNVQVRERVLPAKVIRTHMAEHAVRFEERQGYKPGRKQMAEIKESIIADLLPTAFIKPVDILCMLTGNYLMIGAASARLVDTALLQLRGAFPEQPLALKSIAADRDVRKWLTVLLKAGTTASGDFTIGESVVLKGKDKSVARFKDIDLSKQAITDSAIDGMRPSELVMTYKERIEFALSDQLVIKRIRFGDVILKQDDDDGNAAVRFDTAVTLIAGELQGLVDALLTEIPDEEEL